MTGERILWWIVLLFALRYSWLSFRKASAPSAPADVSGTRVLETGAEKIRRHRVMIGSEALTDSGPIKLTYHVGIVIGGQEYDLTLEEKAKENG